MKANEYDITEAWFENCFEGYEVRGYVNGNFFGVVGTFRSEDEAKEHADFWAGIDHFGDARVSC